MPDWVVHLGTAYAVYRPFTQKDLRWIFLGAILPDVFARVDSVLTDVFHMAWHKHYTLAVFHTPFIMCLMALAIALFTDRVIRTWILVFGASLFHIFMDLCETKLPGYGQLLLYPINYKTYRLDFFHYGSAIYYALLVVSFGLILWHVRESRIIESHIQLKNVTSGRLILAGILLAVICVLPYFAWQNFIDHNVGYELFFRHPEKFENQEITLHFSEVISAKPVKIREREYIIEVVGVDGFKVGDWISVRGVYRNGKVFPGEVWLEDGLSKIWFSLFGLVMFPFLWFDPKKLFSPES